MSLTCPVCRAANEAGLACRRCRADLTLCFAVESQRDAALAAARAAAQAGRTGEALEHATAAQRLRRVPETDCLLAALHLLAGNLAAVWTAYSARR